MQNKQNMTRKQNKLVLEIERISFWKERRMADRPPCAWPPFGLWPLQQVLGFRWPWPVWQLLPLPFGRSRLWVLETCTGRRGKQKRKEEFAGTARTWLVALGLPLQILQPFVELGLALFAALEAPFLQLRIVPLEQLLVGRHDVDSQHRAADTHDGAAGGEGCICVSVGGRGTLIYERTRTRSREAWGTRN